MVSRFPFETYWNKEWPTPDGRTAQQCHVDETRAFKLFIAICWRDNFSGTSVELRLPTSLWPLHRTTLQLEDSFTIECGIVSVGLRSERWFGLSITDAYSRAVGPGGMSGFEDTSQRATLEDRPKKAALRLESSSGGEHRWHSAEAVWRHALPLDRCKSSSVGQETRY